MNASQLFSALVIDDDPMTGFLTGAVLLESKQFNEPVVFSKAEKAFRYILNQCLVSKSKPLPHLLLVDVSSPDGTGLECLEALKEIGPDVFDQIVVCGLVSPHSTQFNSRAKDLPLDFYLPKPLNREDLEQLLCFLESRVSG
jgi:CheY-like chemotaxis protein